ncbi:MAG: TonB family protein [Planctomycetota bacterium]|jgi:TonB family protein
MNLPVAVGIAILLHLLFLLGTEVLPGLRAAWLPEIPHRQQPEPLQFTFVDLPEEPPEPERPPENARPSDRTREVRSEPAPPEAEPSPDPFAQGNTDQRIDSQPAPEPAPERAQPERQPKAQPEPMKEQARQLPPGAQEMFPAPPDDAAENQPEEEVTEKLEGLDEMLRPFSSRDLGQRFDNSQAASVTDFGPISFDTVGIDWGPYARKIVEIVRARWIERLPPAARLGLKGRSVVSFRIALDGGVSTIVLKESSGTRPFDKAAEFAIEASELPPLPQAFLEMGEDDVGVTFQFYYNMRVPQN